MKDAVLATKTSLLDMQPGFRLLTDLSNLENMDSACAVYIAELMDICSKRGVSAVARVVPDPAKDIGFAIMSRFHHRRDVCILTFENRTAAMLSLAA